MVKRIKCNKCGRIYYKKSNRQQCPGCKANKEIIRLFDLNEWVLCVSNSTNKGYKHCKLIDPKYYKATKSYDKEYYQRRRDFGLAMPTKAANTFKSTNKDLNPKHLPGPGAYPDIECSRKATYFRLYNDITSKWQLLPDLTINGSIKQHQVPIWIPKPGTTMVPFLVNAYEHTVKDKLTYIKCSTKYLPKGKKRYQVVDPYRTSTIKSTSTVGVNCVPAEVASCVDCFGKTIAKKIYGNKLVELYKPRKPRKSRKIKEHEEQPDWELHEVYKDNGEVEIKWNFIPKVEKVDKTELTPQHNSRSKYSSYKYKPGAVYKPYKSLNRQVTPSEDFEEPGRYVMNGFKHATDSKPTHSPTYAKEPYTASDQTQMSSVFGLRKCTAPITQETTMTLAQRLQYKKDVEEFFS
jgi:hypothetical protein